MKIKKTAGAEKPFAHALYFQLSDSSEELHQAFLDLCVQYLSGHPGQQQFTAGYRVLEIDGQLSAGAFDVAVHMVFESMEAYDAYTRSEHYEAFITASAGMCLGRVAYDSYVQVAAEPAKR